MKKKKLIILIPIAVGVAVIAILALRFGYVEYKSNRFAELGDTSIERGDWRMASFWYQSVLELKPNDGPIIDKLCRYSDVYNDPESSKFWALKMQSESDSSDGELGLIRSYLRNRDFDEAKKLILELDADTKSSEYHLLVAGYHMSIGGFSAAEKYSRLAITSSNNSVESRLILLNILLRQGFSRSKTEIDSLIQSIESDSESRAELWRVFIDYAINTDKEEQAYFLFGKLVSSGEASWSEKLEYVKLMVEFEEDIMPFLFALDDVDPSLVESISSLLISKDFKQEALRWLKTYDSKRFNESVSYQIAYADVLSKQMQWTSLIDYLDLKNWEKYDYYRHALISLAYKELGNSNGSLRKWKKAVDHSNESVNEQLRLAQMVETWPEFQTEWLSLMDDMLVHSAHRSWVYQKLHKHYTRLGKTWDLYRISTRALNTRLNEPQVENNFLFYSLLLGKELSQNLKKAEILFETEGAADPSYALTFALALYKNGDTRAALKTLKTLDLELQLIPEVSYYFAIYNYAISDDRSAEIWLKKSKGAHVLPEEEHLLKQYQ